MTINHPKTRALFLCIGLVLTPGAANAQESARIFNFFFNWDETALPPQSNVVLDQIADFIEACPNDVRMELHASTDRSGSVAYNEGLSEKRAEAVIEAFNQHAILAQAMPFDSVITGGETERVYPHLDPQDNARHVIHRHAEIFVTCAPS